MKIERAKNTSRNIIFGIILKVYQIICPFIIRTAMIYILGMEYVGLNSLFNAILQVLNLTELGVGTAMVFCMYKPIAEDDDDTICKLMQLYKVYYRIIGVIIAIVGLLITPIVPKLISSDSLLPVNVYYIYWLNLGYTVISYWLFAYKGSVINAHQRMDITSKITIVINTLMYIFQVMVIVIFKNYYLYLVVMLFGQASSNIVTAIVADRMYPNYKAKGHLERDQIKEINLKVRDLFTSKIGGVIQNSADSIVISSFLGLTLLAKYNNYYYIMNSVFGFVIILFNSSMAGVGNSLVTETIEKNYKDLKKMTFLTEWVAGFSACSLLCLYQPFMKIWVGEDNLLPIGIVICLSIYILIIITNQMLCLYKDAAGIWHEDRWRPLITAMVNLALNLLSVNIIGLYGVVLSTVISMLVIGMPWIIRNLFFTIFKRSCKRYVCKLFEYILVTCVVSIITFLICSLINDNGIATFSIKLIICLIFPNVCYYNVYHNKKEYKDAMLLVDRLCGGRLGQNKYLKKILF